MYRNFNLDDYCSQMLPPLLRRPVFLAFLRALLKPIDSIVQQYKSATDYAYARVNYNAFTIYMEKHLNDLLNVQNQIHIRDWLIEQTMHIAHKQENKPKDYLDWKRGKLPPVYLSNDRRLLGGFEVMVPTALATEQNLQLIHTHVQGYKFAGKKYKITIY